MSNNMTEVSYTASCAERLPCGVCKLLKSKCPNLMEQPIVTWATSTGTNAKKAESTYIRVDGYIQDTDGGYVQDTGDEVER